MKKINKFGISAILASTLMISTHAIAEESETAKTEIEIIAKPHLQNQNFVSDGSPISLDVLGIVINPPKEWNVRIGNGEGPSVVMEESRDSVNSRRVEDTEQTLYQRNITLSMKHEGAPIDTKQIEIMTEELKNVFGKNSLIQNFEVIESSIIDYQNSEKAILIYTSYMMGKAQLMQMHLFVANESKQFLQTYTDLASRFAPEDSGFLTAWNSMTTLTYEGKAQVRYQNLIQYGSIAGGSIFGLLVLVGLRSKRRKSKFKKALHELDDTPITMDSDFEESAEENFESLGKTAVRVVSEENSWSSEDENNLAEESEDKFDEVSEWNFSNVSKISSVHSSHI